MASTAVPRCVLTNGAPPPSRAPRVAVLLTGAQPAPKPAPSSAGAGAGAASGGGGNSSAGVSVGDSFTSKLDSVREATGLGSLQPRAVFTALRKYSTNGQLRREEFTSGLLKFLLDCKVRQLRAWGGGCARACGSAKVPAVVCSSGACVLTGAPAGPPVCLCRL
jgi:hypothetical protein